MKKKVIIGIGVTAVIVFLIGAFICTYFYESIFCKSRHIQVNYMCEIPISLSMEDIGLIKYATPRLRWISVSEYENLLGEVFDKSDLSESEIENIRNLIEMVPDDKYIYMFRLENN